MCTYIYISSSTYMCIYIYIHVQNPGKGNKSKPRNFDPVKEAFKAGVEEVCQSTKVAAMAGTSMIISMMVPYPYYSYSTIYLKYMYLQMIKHSNDDEASRLRRLLRLTRLTLHGARHRWSFSIRCTCWACLWVRCPELCILKDQMNHKIRAVYHILL